MRPAPAPSRCQDHCHPVVPSCTQLPVPHSRTDLPGQGLGKRDVFFAFNSEDCRGEEGTKQVVNCPSVLQAPTRTYKVLVPPPQIKARAYSEGSKSAVNASAPCPRPQAICTSKEKVWAPSPPLLILLSQPGIYIFLLWEEKKNK